MRTARGGQLLALPLLALIRLYQLLVSPLLPPMCRYTPSCSAYAGDSLRRHGALRGGYLAAHRLVRCNPWSRGGVDHVPATWAERGSPELSRPRLGEETSGPASTAEPAAGAAPADHRPDPSATSAPYRRNQP